MLSASILGVGLCGPGLNGWPQGVDVLSGIAPFTGEETKIPFLGMIPPGEQRRLSPIVRLALAVAEEAVSQAGIDAREISAVFGWPHGNNWVLQKLFEALCSEDRFISPTDFHNSVHNVAVGYWSIHTRCQRPCTSVSAEIDTFAASLMKAFAQMEAERCPVLLTVTDAPFQEPLNAVCPTGAPFAAALMLAPHAKGVGVASLGIDHEIGPSRSLRTPEIAALQYLWKINAAARALPFLECLASGQNTELFLPYGPHGGLAMKIEF